MTPLKLTLKNFEGIRSAMGKDEYVLDLQDLTEEDQVVSFLAGNGGGKTTIMDNLHPYRIMPSHAKSYSPGGFSYYDHIGLGEALKELFWEYREQVYRSTLEFKVTEKTRTCNAYLHLASGDDWEIAKHPDGTTSDGKGKTYDKCLEEIIGSPELYFTTVFSAQQKKPISTYLNSEIKQFMAELLDLEWLSKLSDDAKEVAEKLTKALEEYEKSTQYIESELLRSSNISIDINKKSGLILKLEEEMYAQDTNLVDLNKKLGAVEAILKSNIVVSARREAIDGKLRKLITSVEKQTAVLGLERNGLKQKIYSARVDFGDKKVALEKEIADFAGQKLKMESFLGEEDEMILAQVVALALAKELVEKKSACDYADELQNKNDKLQILFMNQLADVKASQYKYDLLFKEKETLDKKVNFMVDVPCLETEYPGQCPLLKDSMAAKGELETLSDKIKASLKILNENEDALNIINDKINDLNYNKFLYVKIKKEYKDLETEKAEALKKAEGINDIKMNQANLELAVEREKDSREKLKQAEEYSKKNINALSEQLEYSNSALDKLNTEYKSDRDELESERSECVYEDCSSEQIELSIKMTGDLIAEQKIELGSLERDITTLKTQNARVDELKQNLLALNSKIEKLKTEISQWNVTAKSLGKDGIIALSIDDAGPSISVIANDILLECYGPRFTLMIETQSSTNKGKLKETFEIIVFDSKTDTKKSIKLMSVGEKTWILDALVRAIAIYRANQSDKGAECLFSDEADGALDPERKRMFMKMKKSVLKIGGYRREFFISHTPELQHLADHVIKIG